MDTTDPDITFDQNGHCNHCTDYLDRTKQLYYQGDKGEKIFEGIVKKIKKAGRNRKKSLDGLVVDSVDSKVCVAEETFFQWLL